MLDVNGKTVAIVCNGSSLKVGGYSSLIDSHDIVVRMNHGGVYSRLFPDIVGLKTSIYATNCFNGHGYTDVLEYINNLSSEVEILAVRPYHGLLRKDFHITEPFMRLFNQIDNKIHIIPNSFYINNMINGYYNFSTGIAVLLFFSKLQCKKINVFGYDNGVGSYFYEEKNTIFNHNRYLENKIYENELYKNSRITFFR